MSHVRLLDHGCILLRQCFAGPDALVPRVIKLGVTSTSAVSEPRTTAATATYFPRFRNDPAFGAYETDGRRRNCYCEYVIYVNIAQNQNTKMKTRKQSLLGMRKDVSIYMELALDLHLQASTPSNHL